jgi:hypothetical protein
MAMSPLKRSSEDVEHEDGRRPAPRTPRIRACESELMHDALYEVLLMIDRRGMQEAQNQMRTRRQ